MLRTNKLDELTFGTSTVKAKEQLMLKCVLDTAKAFYQDPNNLKAFEVWKQNKNMEEFKNADHNDT